MKPQPDPGQLERLILISRDLASTLDLEMLLERIVVAATELTDAEASAILLFDSDRETLHFQASSNMDTQLMRGMIVPVDGSIAGWIAQNRQPVIVDDPESDSRFFPFIQQQSGTETHNILGVPLIMKDQVIGVLEAINKAGGAFSNSDLEILMTLGPQAAIAIDNARLFAQSDLVAEMVHELRTPLSSLNAATHLLLRPDLSEAKHQSLVLTIRSEVGRLSEMATDFLDLARLESGRMKFDIHYIEPAILLGECVGITRSSMEARGIRLLWRVPDDLPRISGDPEKLKQVFLNLLSNAVKYNREGGKITLTAGIEDRKLKVAVADTGLGIPDESFPHLFEKFYRVPGTENVAQGTGLGLSIVMRIVKSHGGDVHVSSKDEGGTKFTVLLPCETPRAQQESS